MKRASDDDNEGLHSKRSVAAEAWERESPATPPKPADDPATKSQSEAAKKRADKTAARKESTQEGNRSGDDVIANLQAFARARIRLNRKGEIDSEDDDSFEDDSQDGESTAKSDAAVIAALNKAHDDADIKKPAAKRPPPQAHQASGTSVSYPSAKNFAERLMSILEMGIAADMIWWIADGKAVALHQKRLKKNPDLVQLHFNVQDYSAFIRNFTRWGFRRVTHYAEHVPPGIITYQNVLFQKAQPQLVKLMRIDSDVQRQQAIDSISDMSATRHQTRSDIPNVFEIPSHQSQQAGAGSISAFQPQGNFSRITTGTPQGSEHPQGENRSWLNASSPALSSLINQLSQGSQQQTMGGGQSCDQLTAADSTSSRESMVLLDQIVNLSQQYLIRQVASTSQAHSAIQTLIHLLQHLHAFAQHQQQQQQQQQQHRQPVSLNLNRSTSGDMALFNAPTQPAHATNTSHRQPLGASPSLMNPQRQSQDHHGYSLSSQNPQPDPSNQGRAAGISSAVSDSNVSMASMLHDFITQQQNLLQGPPQVAHAAQQHQQQQQQQQRQPQQAPQPPQQQQQHPSSAQPPQAPDLQQLLQMMLDQHNNQQQSNP